MKGFESMASREFVPGSDTALAAWLLHFASKVDTHAPAIAVSAAEIAALKADAAMVEWTLKVLPSLRASGQQFTSFKEDLLNGQTGGAPCEVPVAPTFLPAPAAVPTGAIPRARALAQRIKKSPGYTEAIGRDLGLIAPATDAVAAEASKPTFRATSLPHSEIRLDWVKGRHSGVVIQGKRAGDTDWVDLGKDNYSPYVDGRSPVTASTSETRQYRARYLDKDNEVGEWSDVVSAVTTA
jgi:hypothetical protein